MRNLKRIICLLLVLCLLLTIGACRKSKPDDSTSGTETVYVEEVTESGTDNSSKDEDIASGEGSSKNEGSSSNTSSSIDNVSSGDSGCEHRKIDVATCTEPQKCRSCGASIGEPTGHRYNKEKSVCVACNAPGPNWVTWYNEDTYKITETEVKSIMSQQYKKPKNVIVMIADGMGPNDVAIAEKYSYDTYDFGLVLNKFVNTGYSTTYSANSSVTDSAASATALATGVKTNNGMIGMSPERKNLTNISEIARKYGKKVGIVTTDQTVGATPSAFAVHNPDRSASKEIAQSFVDFAPDVLIGQMTSDYNGLDLSKFLVTTSFDQITTKLNTDIGNTKPYLGLYDEDVTSGVTNILAHYTEVALNRLKNDNGFFLMVESAGTDWGGHGSNIDLKMNSVVVFDRAVAVVLKFMKENPDTLLIITSDHETGGVQMPSSREQVTNALFTSNGSHTGVNVRTFALGYGAEYFKSTVVDNTDIAIFAMKAVKG